MDGVTYGNSCTAEAACAEIAYQGECVGGGVVGVNPGGGTGMANPASVYCEEQGGTLEIADTPDGQVGMCHFADQTCEEWALFRSNATNCTGADGTLAKTYCKPEQRNVQACTMEYGPVCGWFDSSINCLAYPCAQTASNPCMACADPKVEYYTGGECPEVGGR
jgi:putative hemolysin